MGVAALMLLCLIITGIVVLLRRRRRRRRIALLWQQHIQDNAYIGGYDAHEGFLDAPQQPQQRHTSPV